MATARAYDLARKRRRTQKTKKLKAKIEKTTSDEQKKKLATKLMKVNPYIRVSV